MKLVQPIKFVTHPDADESLCVGDRVKVNYLLGAQFQGDEPYDGQLGTITGDGYGTGGHKGHWVVFVDLDNGMKTQWSPENLELIPSRDPIDVLGEDYFA